MLSDVFGAELCYAALVHMVGADLILVFLNLILCAVKCTLFCILCLHFYSKLPPSCLVLLLKMFSQSLN